MRVFEQRLAGRLALTCLAVVSFGLTPALASAQAPSEPPRDWVGTAGVGLSVTSGNSDTVNVNVAADVTRTPKARNVILLIGDGMGIAHRTAGRVLSKGYKGGKANGTMAMDRFPFNGMLNTSSLNSQRR